MKVREILRPMREDLLNFLEFFGQDDSENDCFYVMIGNNYYQVDMEESYWYFEDDGSIVFRVNSW